VVAPTVVAPTVQPLAVPLGYPIYCHAGALNVVGSLIAQHAPAHRYVVIADETVAPLYAQRVVQQLPPDTTHLLTIPAGEQHKTRAQWGALTDAMAGHGVARDTTVIALGGGVVGDLAGFVAATYMRGLPVIQIPTTLLAMVDASVGGKTAVDTSYGKNVVGVFHAPSAVIIDPTLLASLSPTLLRTGLAEVIKHGVVADVSYFDQVLAALPAIRAHGAQAPQLSALIAGSVAIKAAVVAEDTREGGMRQILNFGHTIAHAIERELNYDMLHGDAVAIGMLVEARIAERLGLATPGLRSAIAGAVESAGLPGTLPPNISAESVLLATYGDKKVRSGLVRYALPRAVGVMESAEGRWSVPVNDDVVLWALTE
jgi:3-dehydroquinate synthase